MAQRVQGAMAAKCRYVSTLLGTPLSLRELDPCSFASKMQVGDMGHALKIFSADGDVLASLSDKTRCVVAPDGDGAVTKLEDIIWP